jgi:alpha-amylase
MPSVCFYFQVHQPYRIKKYNFLDIGKDSEYFETKEENDLNNRFIMEKVARKSYIPTNKLLFKLLKKYPEFRFTFSFSGVALEQMEKYSKEALKTFQDLINTGRVEVLGETYYHSLSFLYSKKEFQKQVEMNVEKIKDLFHVKPRVFRCTELAYSNEIAKHAQEMGFEGILGEGVDHILGWRSPNFLYKTKDLNIKLFLKNYRLSDDIAFRFSEKSWKEHPLTAEKFGKWISDVNGNGEIVNLFMDYETFGEHQWEETGIFNFLEALPKEILKHKDNDFAMLSESIDRYNARDEIDVPNITSWADMERDLSAWVGNEMQKDALDKLYKLEEDVLFLNDKEITDLWRRFQTSDQVYYMSTKGMGDGTVHGYFSPYKSPYDAFISFSNALSDFKLRIEEKRFLKINKII